MGRSFEISGDSIVVLFYAVSLAALLPLFAIVVTSVEGIGGIALAVLIASLTVAGGIGAWRRRTGREDEHLGTDEDLAYDPIAYPWQAPRRARRKVGRRLSNEDGDDED
jgi:hypothetical protein